MKKRIISALLALTMVVALPVSTVFADEALPADSITSGQETSDSETPIESNEDTVGDVVTDTPSEDNGEETEEGVTPEIHTEEIPVEIRASSAVIGDDYPSKYKFYDNGDVMEIDAIVDEWKFYNRECTSFVAWRLNSVNGVHFTNQYGEVERWGNAGNWGDVAQGLGIRVDNTPAVGSVFWCRPNEYGALGTGHVAWVAEVDGDYVTIEEYNCYIRGEYQNPPRKILSSQASGYIHIADIQSEGYFTYGDLECRNSNNQITITHCNENAVSVDIPAKINGIPVTSIGARAFSGCKSLTSVTIPDGVTFIGENAFGHCESLTSIVIPNGITSIGEDTFNCCTSLTSVIIPGSVTSIGDWAFSWCKSLTSITIPYGVTSIGLRAFDCCEGLTSIIVPDTVTSIGNHAFEQCISLTSITIPDGVTSIGTETFYNCESLTSITIPNSVTSIRNDAFGGCESLTSITIPNSVIYIGDRAFSWCTSVTDVYYSGSESDWEAIYIGTYNEELLNANIHYNGEHTNKHNYGTEWKNDDINHWQECSCGDKINIAQHEEDSGTITILPTYVTPGTKIYRCTVCKKNNAYRRYSRPQEYGTYKNCLPRRC